jgi:hypothetical protein
MTAFSTDILCYRNKFYGKYKFFKYVVIIGFHPLSDMLQIYAFPSYEICILRNCCNREGERTVQLNVYRLNNCNN